MSALTIREALDNLRDHYGRLHDALSDCIEAGRLTAAELPDDYAALVELLAQAAAADEQAAAALASRGESIAANIPELLALRDEMAQGLAVIELHAPGNADRPAFEALTPLDPSDPQDARLIAALRAGHGRPFGLRLAADNGALSCGPDSDTDEGRAIFELAAQLGAIARGEIATNTGGAMQ